MNVTMDREKETEEQWMRSTTRFFLITKQNKRFSKISREQQKNVWMIKEFDSLILRAVLVFVLIGGLEGAIWTLPFHIGPLLFIFM